jgi:hypothetical protein
MPVHMQHHQGQLEVVAGRLEADSGPYGSELRCRPESGLSTLPVLKENGDAESG